MGKRMVTLIYYKETGKYLTSASYLTNLKNDFEIHNEVRAKRLMNDLPGIDLDSELWSGYCVIDPESGVRQLLDFTKDE